MHIRVGRPINAKGRGNLLREGQLERWLRLAATRDDVGGILVVCDAERDPACDLGPRLNRRCAATLPHIPVRATLAVRQFENWIIASAQSTNGRALEFDGDVEAMPAAEIVRTWRRPKSYIKPLHQAGYAARIDHAVASQNSPSFARILRCIEELAQACAVEP